MNFFNKNNNPKGFTIIEVLVGVSIFTMIGLALAAFQKNIFSLDTFISGSLTSQNEARKALKTTTYEMRMISPSNLGAYPIIEANSGSFTFYSDIDGDSLKEQVRYFLENGTLKKGVIKPTGNPLSYNPLNEEVTEIIYNVINSATPLFSYYDENYDGAGDPLQEPVNLSAIRLIKIIIEIDKNISRPPGMITLTTQVSARNLKDNL